MGKIKVIYIDEDDLPPRYSLGKPWKKSWLPWKAVEQIPQGMALELTPWLGERSARNAGATLLQPASRLSKKFPHLRVIQRGSILFLWHPSSRALESLEYRDKRKGRQIRH